MGMFSAKQTASLEMYDVPAAEGYFGEAGANLALIESIQNDERIFEAIIRHDFHEAVLFTEGASEEEIGVVQEASMGEAIQFLKDFFQKLLAKIKGIFESAVAKFQSIFMKDNKEFYKKYVDLLHQRNTNKDWSKFTFKYSAPKKAGGIIPKYNGGSGTLNVNEYHYTKGDYKAIEKDFDSNEWVLKCLGGSDAVNELTSPKDFPKWFHEQCYEEATDVSDWDGSSVEAAMEPLSKGNQIKELKDSGSDLQNRIKKIISAIDSNRKELDKMKGKYDEETKENKYDLSKVTKDFDGDDSKSFGKNAGNVPQGAKDNIQAWLRVMHTKANGEQKAVTMYTGAAVREAKFGYAQARRLTAAAIAFLNSKKSVAESYADEDYVSAIQEASDFDFDMEFESPYIDDENV